MHAIIWDLDGTIADTAPAHFAAWQDILSREGIEYTHKQFIDDFGRNNSELLPELMGPQLSAAQSEEISNTKEALYRHYLHQGYSVQLMPGVAEWLQRFDDAGVKQAVGSSGTMSNITAVIEQLEIGDYFHGLLSGLRLPRGKPHPALFLNVAAAIEMSAADCIVIEDSVHGIEAARRAGMASIAVGHIVDGPTLDALLARVPGPSCLPVRTLTDLSWAQVKKIGQGDRSASWLHR